MTTQTAPHFSIPPHLDPADWAQLQPLYRALIDRPIHSPHELERWLLDLSTLSAYVGEYGSRRHIEHSRHTDDPEVEKKFLHWIQHISPKLKPVFFEIQKKYIASPFRDKGPLDTVRFHMLDRGWKMDVELFREENVALQTESDKVNSDAQKINAAMMVNFRGKDHTLQQMGRYAEEPDRQTRQEAWTAAEARRAQDRAKLEEIFEKLLDLRGKMADNADCENFREYTWKNYNRFDYKPDDCHEFAKAVEHTCLPIVHQLNETRRKSLKLEKLRPWDMGVDPHNRPPLRPFKEDDMNQFVSKTTEVFDRISPLLGKEFRELKMDKNLDLESRKGKQPGGYQSSLEHCKEPFIFMNAAGVQRDVETLLHEGGHAFHYMAARHEPLTFLRHAPIEFCEVASMSMELLADDRFDTYYGTTPEGKANAQRTKRVHIEGIVRLLPWIATIDQFQHWLYTNPGHSPDQRAKAWLATLDRFSTNQVDWSGHEDVRQHMWQRQGHLYGVPFYYIEYGIAQLGALGVWFNYEKHPEQALSSLLKAFALGGTRPLPELFQTAGVPFEFSHHTVEPTMKAVQRELSQLPE